MAKLPHQSTTPPVDGTDASTKDYADASVGGGGGSATRSVDQNSQSYLFVNANDDLLSRANPGVFGGLAAMSIECWIRPTALAGKGYSQGQERG